MILDRRRLLAGLAVLGASLPGGRAFAAAENDLTFGEPQPFSFEDIVGRARDLAAAPHAPDPVRASDVLERLDYDNHWKIEYLRRDTLELNKGRAPVRFFHLGRYFKEPVGIHVVENGQARALQYSPALFRIPDDSPARELPDDIGFAGFRVLEPGSDSDWLAFLGGCYFRTSGEENQFGMSCRALAVDVAMPTAEEFPRFTDFWLAPSETGGRLTVFALLDSARITGALKMDMRKDGPVVMDIEARYFARDAVERVGLAALTSMYWFSETDRGRRVDWRPEIHDSDGLAIWTGAGERLWRPLNNPARVMTSTFSDEAPKGFGLLQRDRNFENFEDDGVFYEKRASVWVEPKGSWGKGAVQLVEIPTDDEIHDNIAVYWLAAEPVERGGAIAIDYRLTWGNQAPVPVTVGHVVATRLGRGGIAGQPRPPGVTKIVIDFDGGLVAGLGREAQNVEAVVSTSRGTISLVNCYAIKVGTAWRATFDFAAGGEDPAELRAYLKQGDQTLTETWAYQFLPLAGPGGA